jgi:hypothetical protein
MTAPSRPHAPFPSRIDLAGIAVVIALGLAVYGWVAAYNYTITTFTDSLDYMFMAEFYRSAIHGGDLYTTGHYYRITRYPPLLPMLLGALGAGVEHAQLASLISNVIAVLGALAVWWWVRREFNSAVAATAIACALLLFPYHFVINLSPVSEPLGILLMAAAFALLAGPRPTGSRLLAAGLLIGLAPLARTAMLPLPIAFVIWLAIARPQPLRQLALPVAAAWAPILAWLLYRRTLGAQQYTSFLSSEQFAEVGMRWPEALWIQPLRLFDAFVQGWGVEGTPWLMALSALILALAMVGGLLRLRRNKLDAWFLGGYLALIAIWPFPAELRRFLVAVYPCLLVCCLAAVQQIDVRFARSRLRVATAALVAVVAAANLPAALRYVHRATIPVETELLGDKREPGFFLLGSDKLALDAIETYARGRIVLEQAGTVMPEGECLYALPAQIGRFFSKRPTLPYPFGLGTDPASVDAALHKCDYFFIGAWNSQQHRVRPYYPSDAMKDWAEPVLVSYRHDGGKSYLAAALLVRKQRGTTGPAPATGMHEPTNPEQR